VPGEHHVVLEPQLVQQGVEVSRQVLVGVGVRLGSGIGLAVAAGVVADELVSAAGKEARALHHVAAGGGQAVEQHDRAALAATVPAEGRPRRGDLQGLGLIGHCV
jgi:hypothetical protein